MQYRALAGEHIDETARNIVALAVKHDDFVFTEFNGVPLVAYNTHPGNHPDFHVTMYNLAMDRQRRDYENSEKGKQDRVAAKKRIEQMQRKHDKLMRQLPDLDFTDLAAVLDWIYQYQVPSDYCGVVKQQGLVVGTLASHGYYPNVNCGEEFRANDRENVARYIIGQAIAMLAGEVGAIHQIVGYAVEDWRKKFAGTAI